MGTVRAAAIYARISADIEGTGQGIKRQVQDCRKLAKDLDWPIYDEYVDNDISAYSGKVRPSYERMLDDIRAGQVDAVLVYNLDRLTRRPIEFEDFNDILSQAKVTQVRFVTGDVDLGTDDGLFYGRMQAAFAAKESAVKSRRVKRKLDQVAAEGRPHGGSNRPFGFQEDKITHKPDEVKVIRAVLARFLAGESTRSIAIWLDQQGVRTVRGGTWRTTSVNAMLTKPRMIGLREHRDGSIAGPAVWKAILTPEEQGQVLAIIDAKKRSGRREPRRYLLSGKLRCGRCKERLYSQARKTTRRYVCIAGPDHGGCGRLTVVASPLEELVAESLLLRLDTPELATALSGAARQDSDDSGLMDAVAEDREHLDELARLNANKQITVSEWMTARKVIEDRMHANERRLRRSTNTSALAPLLGKGDALRPQWSSLNLARQRAIVDAVVSHVIVDPGQSGARNLDPERVDIRWSL
jgi:DNA invertase Pin-like site-specific DNA recombinase